MRTNWLRQTYSRRLLSLSVTHTQTSLREGIVTRRLSARRTTPVLSDNIHNVSGHPRVLLNNSAELFSYRAYRILFSSTRTYSTSSRSKIRTVPFVRATSSVPHHFERAQISYRNLHFDSGSLLRQTPTVLTRLRENAKKIKHNEDIKKTGWKTNT